MPYSPFPRMSQGSQAFEPIDFSEGIANLGNLIDAIGRRRIDQARADRELAMKEEDRTISKGREARLEQQNLRGARTGWMEKNRQEVERQRAQVARQGTAQPILWTDEQGNSTYIKPEEIGAPTPQPSVPRATPEQGPEDINSLLSAVPRPPVVESQAAPQFKPEPELDSLMGQSAPPPSFSTTSVPPASVRGASYRAPNEPATVENMADAALPVAPPQPTAPMGKKWQYRIQGQEPLVLDQEQAAGDVRRQREVEAEGIRQQLQRLDPSDPQYALLSRHLTTVLGGIPPKTEIAMQGSIDRGLDRTSRETIAAGANASREKIAAGHDDTRRATSKYGRPGAAGRAAVDADPSSGANNPWATLESKQRSREGQRLNREKRDWANNHGWTKLLTANPGRLEWAAENIKMTGPGAGAAQAEAMMNLFGVARGGVPVKNETQEFMRATKSLQSTMDEIGASIGLPQLGSRLARGESLTGADAKKYEDGVSAMPEQRRFAIERAIKSTQDALLGWGRREVASMKKMWDPEPLANRYKATAFINEMGAHLGMESRQIWKDVPLSKTQTEDSAAAPTGPSPTASSALERALGGE